MEEESDLFIILNRVIYCWSALNLCNYGKKFSVMSKLFLPQTQVGEIQS